MLGILAAMTLNTLNLPTSLPPCPRAKEDGMLLLNNNCDSNASIPSPKTFDSAVDNSTQVAYKVHVPLVPDWNTPKGLDLLKNWCAMSLIVVGDGAYIIYDDKDTVATCIFGEFMPDLSSHGNGNE